MNKHLCLSERNRAATDTDTDQLYPDHPDRFDEYRQVLCRESVCGRCYWELEWSGDVEISVSYKSIRRKGDGDECVFGSNDQSWCLCCTPSRYSFRHNNIKTDLSVKPISSRIGVSDEDDDDDDSRRIGVHDDDDDDDSRRIGVSDEDDDDDDSRRIEVYDDDDNDSRGIEVYDDDDDDSRRIEVYDDDDDSRRIEVYEMMMMMMIAGE